MKKYLLDTNVIIRYLLQDHKELFKKARYFFDLIKMGKARALLEQTVFTETIYVLSRVYEVTREDIAISLYNLLMLRGVLNAEKEVLLKSLEIYSSTKLHIVDCIIVAKSIEVQVEIMSFDKELKQLAADSLTSVGKSAKETKKKVSDDEEEFSED